MNAGRLVLGAHLVVAAVLLIVGLLAGLNGDLVQFGLLSAVGVMVGLLGRSVSRLAAAR
ncbi:hypothetical protein [Haloarcula halophila]|uniref:hypothetical protein n=1 Tax=Haloarcula TaxID=2237 RepID=UPI0023E3F492|nr:hypothetical protein [Halomicroarcula sp. DFY41]